MRQLDL